MKRAGNLALLLVTVAASGAFAQAPLSTTPGLAPTPLPQLIKSSERESSLTVQQIVARQEEHFNHIKNAQGTAVHTDTRYTETGQPQPSSTQYIFFAYEGDHSVTLALPQQAAQLYRSNQGQIAWGSVLSAFHITGDTVYSIRVPDSNTGGTTQPRVMATPFNPAIHENNPLVRFHPRQISDEQMPLRDLARAIPNMAERPRVFDIKRDDKPLIKIDFANANTPGERLTYLIDPARGYLPTEITHLSNSRLVSKSQIVIGHTPDGTWIPARRERIMYTTTGKPASRQTWHYDYLAINQKLAPKTLSLMYFNLSPSTPITVVKSDTAAGKTPAPQIPAPRPAVRPTATPVPKRVAPQPLRVPL